MELRDAQARDETAIRQALAAEGWTQDQIEGQLAVVKTLVRSDAGLVLLADEQDSFAGFVSAQFYGWNRLVQIHGLAVIAPRRRDGVAARLVGEVEKFARSLGARGIYADTPVNNEVARAFYVANGYAEAYRMPRYYADDLDGVTYTKFFR